jgi:hypothetical protein
MHVKWPRRGGFQFTVRNGLAPLNDGSMKSFATRSKSFSRE